MLKAQYKRMLHPRWTLSSCFKLQTFSHPPKVVRSLLQLPAPVVALETDHARLQQIAFYCTLAFRQTEGREAANVCRCLFLLRPPSGIAELGFPFRWPSPSWLCLSSKERSHAWLLTSYSRTPAGVLNAA